MKYLTFIAIVLVSVSAFAKADNKILNAIRMVESGGNDNVKDGDNGKAIGPFQIHKEYWQDAIEFDSTIGGKYQDCRNRAYAEKIVVAYWKRYCKKALSNNDYETLAKVHNGGLNGVRVKATEAYWEKVKTVLE